MTTVIQCLKSPAPVICSAVCVEALGFTCVYGIYECAKESF